MEKGYTFEIIIYGFVLPHYKILKYSKTKSI